VGVTQTKEEIMNTLSQPETSFTLTIDAQEVRVRYQPNYIGGTDPYALIEFTSPHQPRRRIPVSETGHRSFFAPMWEIEAAPSLEKYTGLVATFLISEQRGPEVADADQLVYRFIKSYPFVQGPGKPSSGGPQAFH
jgi:hypothetical protein